MHHGIRAPERFASFPLSSRIISIVCRAESEFPSSVIVSKRYGVGLCGEA